MNQLVDRWQEVSLKKPPFKLAADKVQGVEFESYADFTKSEDFGKSSSTFHLGLIPQPYIGNLANAKIFLLMLNPGFSPGDYYAQEHCAAFRKARVDNLTQENGNDEYPFFYLNPEFAWTAGGQWWQNKLVSIIKRLESDKGLTYIKALQHISKNLGCLELCPYFSKVYKERKPRLESINLVHNYVQNELAQQCESDNASVILLRQVNIWGLEEGRNVFRLDPKYALGAHLTTKVEAEKTDAGLFKKAGDFMYDKLAALLP